MVGIVEIYLDKSKTKISDGAFVMYPLNAELFNLSVKLQ